MKTKIIKIIQLGVYILCICSVLLNGALLYIKHCNETSLNTSQEIRTSLQQTNEKLKSELKTCVTDNNIKEQKITELNKQIVSLKKN